MYVSPSTQAATSANLQISTLVLSDILVIYLYILAFTTLSTDEWPCATKLISLEKKIQHVIPVK